MTTPTCCARRVLASVLSEVRVSVVEVEVNGERRAVPEGSTVKELLVALGLGDTLVAVERNEAVVPRAEHASTTITAGDRLEVVHFVGGG